MERASRLKWISTTRGGAARSGALNCVGGSASFVSARSVSNGRQTLAQNRRSSAGPKATMVVNVAKVKTQSGMHSSRRCWTLVKVVMDLSAKIRNVRNTARTVCSVQYNNWRTWSKLNMPDGAALAHIIAPDSTQSTRTVLYSKFESTGK